jgi:prevent-host-death family protein
MKVEQIGTLEAKTRLSELLDQVEQGKRFQITRHGKPVAELAPLSKTRKPRFGCGEGLVTYIAPDFDEPLDVFKEYTKEK